MDEPQMVDEDGIPMDDLPEDYPDPPWARANTPQEHRWEVRRGNITLCTCRTREEARTRARRQGGRPRCRVVDRFSA
jgi:hypothetical protein